MNHELQKHLRWSTDNLLHKWYVRHLLTNSFIQPLLDRVKNHDDDKSDWGMKSKDNTVSAWKLSSEYITHSEGCPSIGTQHHVKNVKDWQGVLEMVCDWVAAGNIRNTATSPEDMHYPSVNITMNIPVLYSTAYMMKDFQSYSWLKELARLALDMSGLGLCNQDENGIFYFLHHKRVSCNDPARIVILTAVLRSIGYPMAYPGGDQEAEVFSSALLQELEEDHASIRKFIDARQLFIVNEDNEEDEACLYEMIREAVIPYLSQMCKRLRRGSSNGVKYYCLNNGQAVYMQDSGNYIIDFGDMDHFHCPLWDDMLAPW